MRSFSAATANAHVQQQQKSFLFVSFSLLQTETALASLFHLKLEFVVKKSLFRRLFPDALKPQGII